VIRSIDNKTENRQEKIIPWRQQHLHLNVAVWKPKSLCRHVEEVADATVVALIFIRVATEKMNPPYPLAIVGKKEEELNPQYQET
jgi:hypothetical protein